MKKYKIIEISIIFLILTIVITPNVPSDYKVKTIYVDDNGNKDYQTIKEAIYNAIPGDTIYVYNGTYSEYFAINKSINLIGEDKEKTIIQQNNSVYENYLIKIVPIRNYDFSEQKNHNLFVNFKFKSNIEK